MGKRVSARGGLCGCRIQSHSWGPGPLSWLSKVGKKRILARPAGSCLDTNAMAWGQSCSSVPPLGLSFPICKMQLWIPKGLPALSLEPHGDAI